MKFHYAISEQDYVEMGKLHIKPTRRTYMYLSILFITLSIAAYFFTTPEEYSFEKRILISLIFSSVFTFVMVRISYVTTLYQFRKLYRKSKGLHYPDYSVEITSEGVISTNQDGSGVFRWENLVQWRHNKDFILIYPTPNMYCPIPIKYADSDEFKTTLIRTLTNKVGKSV